MMESVALCCDVLAIRCIDKFIITSIGNQLHIFNEVTGKCLEVIDTFHEDSIHEIVRTIDKRLIVFGGRSLSVFQFQINNDKMIINRKSTHHFNDWIIAASIISPNDIANICVLFAHNILCIFNTLTKNIENTWCEEKCILYAGCISTNNLGEIIVFSGTVFQEILIWKVQVNKKYSEDIPILYRLKGHKGVIFSIFYDPSLKLITSTSDDRTIRLWKIIQSTENVDWNKVEIILKTTIFGHCARVWKSIIVDDNIISIGEDSLICIWTLDGKLCNKIVAHDGATIWSVSVSEDKSKIFTGGADGALNSWPLIYNQTSVLNPTLTFDNEKIPKYVCYLQSGSLLIFFDGGELLSVDPRNRLTIDSIYLPRYESYCIMKVSLDRKKIALAANDGCVNIFDQPSIESKFKFNGKTEKVMDSKIFSLQWLDNDMILICGAKGELKVIKINQNNTCEIQSTFALPTSRERWTTAAVVVSDLLICGDRAGSIYMFSMKLNSDKNPIQFFSKIHGRLGVQSLGVIGKKLTSTGRDGSLRFYEIIKKNNCETYLQALHWKKMQMEWVSRTLKTHDDFYVLGFKEIEFMIYSTRLNRLILRVVCGGGHRSWDCVFKNDIINFACIRSKQIHTLDNISCTMNDSLLPGYHIKEIHTLKRLATGTNENIFVSGSEDCTFRIASIEKSMDSNKYNIKPLETCDGHISNIKSVVVMNLGNKNGCTKNIVFTCGGRAQLKVWEINIDTYNKKLSRHELNVIEKTTFMLRGTDKIRRKTWLDNKKPFFVDPETRFMNISANFHPSNSNFIILFVACSDGFIRVVSYDINCNYLKLNTELPYKNRCVIKVHTFAYENKLILISMATDGLINFWSTNLIIDKILLDSSENSTVSSSMLEPFETWQVHQSGVNAYDFRQTKYNEYYLATGGDDNKVNLSVFTVSLSKSDELSVQGLATWHTVYIHSAQITGIKFIDNNKLLSAAIDQRVVIYHYSYGNSILSVSPIKTIMTFVSDVQGITLFDNPDEDKKLICVYGKGLEAISIGDEDKI